MAPTLRRTLLILPIISNLFGIQPKLEQALEIETNQVPTDNYKNTPM